MYHSVCMCLCMCTVHVRIYNIMCIDVCVYTFMLLHDMVSSVSD